MRLVMLLVVLALVPACTFSSAVAFGPGAGGRAPGQVLVLSADRLDRPYEVVGLVVTQIDTSDQREQLFELRRLAAAMGADAVIGTQLELGFGVWNVGRHLSGTAVRYR
ncbi:MAG TPA: hypothetical protein VGQ83_08830 [Polyangia bacterium]|jgi:hypothetical protein